MLIFFLLVAHSIRQRIKVLRQRYQIIANAELRLGLDVNNYMEGKSECFPIPIMLGKIPRQLNLDLTVLTRTQKVQVLNLYYLQTQSIL